MQSENSPRSPSNSLSENKKASSGTHQHMPVLFTTTKCSTPRLPTKRIFVIRHGQAEHNVDRSFHHRRNVNLTERGVMQCAVVRQRLKELGKDIEVVLTSPVVRCLQTTAAVAIDAPVVVVPDLRECWVDATYRCEAPLDPHEASKIGPFAEYDWNLALEAAALEGETPSSATGEAKYVSHERHADGRLSPWEAELVRSDSKAGFLGNAVGLFSRAHRLADYIRRRPEMTFAIVSHASFLDVLTTDAALGRMANCEVRTYDLMPRGRMPWRRLTKLEAPTMGEMLDMPKQPAPIGADFFGHASRPTSPGPASDEGGDADAGHADVTADVAGGRIRGGSLAGFTTTGPTVRKKRISKEGADPHAVAC